MEKLETTAEETKVCSHKDICPKNIHKFSMKCIFDYKSCKINKFYERYGDNLNYLGIGAKV